MAECRLAIRWRAVGWARVGRLRRTPVRLALGLSPARRRAPSRLLAPLGLPARLWLLPARWLGLLRARILF